MGERVRGVIVLGERVFDERGIDGSGWVFDERGTHSYTHNLHLADAAIFTSIGNQ